MPITKINEQERFELCISSNSVISTDDRFTMNNLSLGEKYKPLDVYFKKANGEEIRSKDKRKISNKTLPRLAFQVFEKQLEALSAEEKEKFPICQYNPASKMICGIYSSLDEFGKYRNTTECIAYRYDNDKQFAIYCRSIFSTIIFVQECLKRFGEEGDHFILSYKDKDDNETITETESVAQKELAKQFQGYKNPFSSMLIKSKNLILRGAPGTGKSYLAKKIAADIISNGSFDDYESLTEEQKKQVEFVQFHPSYDYSDFVEGLRPKINDDATIGFELKDGIFKKFVDCARKNAENFKKSQETIVKAMKRPATEVKRKPEELKPYVFIIDEINRGEISKIFGELFFTIDPGYRGKAGEISTQYANLHSNPDEKFYIPENVYIIGTMNDIDRSVDSFDFAMRRRFRFVELKANERLEMLESLENDALESEAKIRMKALNKEIVSVEDLNENYQIGAAYFLKLKTLTFDQLWTDYLEPLLHEYVQGMYDEKEIMIRFAKAYGYQNHSEGNVDENTQD